MDRSPLFPPCPITGRNWYELTEEDWITAMADPESQLMQEFSAIVEHGLVDEDLAEAVALHPETLAEWMLQGAERRHPYTTLYHIRAHGHRDLIRIIYEAGLRILNGANLTGGAFVTTATFMLDRFGGPHRELYQPPLTAIDTNATVPVDEERPELTGKWKELVDSGTKE